MRIERSERVVYIHNPLAEVICQIRFNDLCALSPEELSSLGENLASDGLSERSQEHGVEFTPVSNANAPTPEVIRNVVIEHFSSTDGMWRASISDQFVAVTCLKYSSWNEFLPKLLTVVGVYCRVQPRGIPQRIGLRYKDVVEREALGLDGVAWSQLVQPFLLGPLVPDSLAEGQVLNDDEVEQYSSQTLLRLDGAMVLLQSALLRSSDGHRRAFLIDADFYKEGTFEPHLLSDPDWLASELEGLHVHSGALFRRAITEKLHNALLPNT